MSDVLDYVSSELQKYIVKLDDFRIGKTIGAGPTGEVFYAYHSPTGTICAVKKLILKKLEGRHLKKFCRELEVLAKVDHDNVLPFIGWTASFPYAIVTKYAENGSLYDALRKKNRKEKLTPTEKTKIAMGISFGMEYLHKKGVMHRSLKSSNVLLDSKYRPMICGFGLSRSKTDESEFMTKQVGSPHWMAPECFIEEKYTNKVDVYSFGILLWEMYTEKTPFEGLSGMDIGLAVTQHAERPKFPDGTPKSFIDAINEIWEQDPEKRLSFEQISRRFMHKKIIFPGTNINDINIYINEIKANPPKFDRQKEPPLSKKAAKKAKKLNLVNPDDEANFTTLQRRHIKRAAAQALLDPTSYFEKLPDPTSPEFESKFRLLIGVVTVDTAPDFFKLIEPLFTQTIPDKVMALVSSEVNKFIKLDDRILQLFVDLNLHTKLSFNTKVALITLKTLLYVTSKIPQAINSKLLEVISPHISVYPKPLIRILANGIMAFDKISNNWEVADYLITNSESFIYNAGVEFIQAFYHLCKNYQQFTQYRLEYVWPIIQKILTLAEPESIHASYCFICEFFDPKVLIPGDILAKHLEKSNLIDDVISYLLRQRDQSIVTEKLLVNLITSLPIKQEAIYIIYNYIISNPEFGKIVASLPWTDSTISIESRIGIISLLLSQQDLIQYVYNNAGVPQLLLDLLETCEVTMIEFGCQIIFKIGQTAFYQTLQESGFFQNYISKIPQLNSGLAVQTSLTMIDIVSRSLFVEDFLSYIPYMVTLVSSQSDYTLPALSALAAYTIHPRAKMTLNGINNIQQTLISINNEQYQPYINIILNNLRS